MEGKETHPTPQGEAGEKDAENRQEEEDPAEERGNGAAAQGPYLIWEQRKMPNNNRKYAAFDLETAAEIPDGDDWREHRPMGITCAALYAPELGDPITWYGTNGGGEIADLMAPENLGVMIRQLENLQNHQGYTILTWNGLGFDFDVLAEESGMTQECRDLAMGHVDMMFHFFCKQGYPLGLDTAAKGMEVEGKTEGMDGGLAVQMWREGERERVIDYCAQDVRSTLAVARACEEKGKLSWTSRTGRSQSLSLRVGWLTVRQALKIPRPDTGWMDEPIPRESFTQWLGLEEPK